MVARGESLESLSLEVERCRSEAKSLELKVTRKEAELRRAREEQTLLKELKTMNDMIVKKKERKEEEEGGGDRGAAPGLRISDDSLVELRALNDALKLENKRTAELQSQADTISKQIEDVERSLETKAMRLAEVKRATNFDVDANKAASHSATLNEVMEKKRILTALHEEQATVLDHSERLTKEIEEIARILESQEQTEQRRQEATESLAEYTRQHAELLEQIKSYERLRKKKERLLQQEPKGDPYAAVRRIEGDKRVLHNNLSSLRETSVSHSKSILSLEVRLRQLETRLEAVDLFLKQVFAEVENDEPMQGVERGDTEVPLALFEDLRKALEISRRTVQQRDGQLLESDAAVEQLERKMAVLNAAIASRTLSSQLQSNSKEKQFETLMEHSNKIKKEYEEERDRLLAENEELKAQLHA